MTIDARSGIISWPQPPQANTPYSVTVQVRDAEGTVEVRSWNITVTTVGFVFVDGSAAAGGDGSRDRPFRSMSGFYGADSNANTYNNNFVYWRAGTYGLEGDFSGADITREFAYPMTSKPHVWLAYPGETVVIDHNLGSAQRASIIQGTWAAGESGHDAFIGGIQFQNMRNHAWRMFGNRITFFENSFQQGGPGADGANSSFLMWQRFDTGGHFYSFIKNCRFRSYTTGTGAAFLKLYGNKKMVIEDNYFSNAELGASGEGNLEGIAVKAGLDYVDIRANTMDSIIQHAIGGNFNFTPHALIRFNNIRGSRSSPDSVYGALVLNYNTTDVGVAHVERNTFQGNVTVREASVEDGPFHFRDNVIISANLGNAPDAGSHIECMLCSAPWRVIVESPNLVGVASDGIVDAEGRLRNQFRSMYLGQKGHELGNEVNDGGSGPGTGGGSASGTGGGSASGTGGGSASSTGGGSASGTGGGSASEGKNCGCGATSNSSIVFLCLALAVAAGNRRRRLDSDD